MQKQLKAIASDHRAKLWKVLEGESCESSESVYARTREICADKCSVNLVGHDEKQTHKTHKTRPAPDGEFFPPDGQFCAEGWIVGPDGEGFSSNQ